MRIKFNPGVWGGVGWMGCSLSSRLQGAGAFALDADSVPDTGDVMGAQRSQYLI